jgi:predicted MFS family arabinose efflux permease
MNGLFRELAVLPRGVFALCAATLVNRSGSMVLAFLTLYATQVLRLDADHAGILLGIYGVCSILASLAAGRITDRIGARSVLATSLLASGAVLVLLAWARSFAALAVGTAVWSLLAEAFRPAAMARLNEGVPAEHRRLAFSLFQVALNAGVTIGSSVGGVLFAASPAAIFWVDGATSVAAGLALLVLDPAPAPASAPGPSPSTAASPNVGERRDPRSAWRDTRLLALLAAMLLAWVVLFQLLGALPLALDARGVSSKQFGILLAAESLLTVVVAIPVTRALARQRNETVLVAGALLLGLGFGGYAFEGGFGVAVLLMLVWSSGIIVMFPAGAARVAELAPPGKQGEYSGLYTASFAVAFAVGPALGTLAYARFGPRWVFGAAFVLCALAALAIHHACRTRPG